MRPTADGRTRSPLKRALWIVAFQLTLLMQALIPEWLEVKESLPLQGTTSTNPL